VTFDKHAAHAMNAERPPIEAWDVGRVLVEPDRDDGHRASKRIGRRLVNVYYDETEDEIHIRTVSATRGRLAP